MSDTPETDVEVELTETVGEDWAIVRNGFEEISSIVLASFARKLERERNEWKLKAMKYSDEVLRIKEEINKLTMRYEATRNY